MALNASLNVCRRFVVLSLLFVLFFAAPAFALTAGEVIDRMTPDQRAAYFVGAIEMATYLAQTQEKNPAKAKCIADWYIHDPAKKGTEEVVAVFRANKQRDAIALLNIVIARHCK